MTADYNGWNDAPEAEREAMDAVDDVLGLAPETPRVAERPRVWRPFPEQVANELLSSGLSVATVANECGFAGQPGE
jgi:hypothetical protein